MTDSDTVFIISGLPADTPQNRDLSRSVGMPEDTPWPKPYKNSTPGTCENCSGAIWIGPETGSMMIKILAEGGDPQILCLICCALLAEREKASVSLIQLTNKKGGE